jgi:hypothetical protein
MAYPEYLPKQTLYHYTSTDDLAGIANSKHLRFSDLADANDPREIHLGREKVFIALRWVLDTEHKAGKGANLLHLITRLIAYFEGVQIFCCCLSLTGDALPMWNAYGANYGGVSIGFRPRAITDMTGRMQRVKYLNAANEDNFRSLAVDIAAQIETIESDTDLKFMSAATSAITAATALKHYTWSYENEVRLVYVQRRERPPEESAWIPVSTSPDGQPIGWRQPSERVVGGVAVRYFDFPFGRFEKGRYDPTRSIEHVVVGPKCLLSVDDVHALLKDHGFDDFTVRPSNCEIR